MISKRLQLKQGATLLIVMALFLSFSTLNSLAQVAKKEVPLFRIGMAGYTFKDLSIDKTIELMNKINVSYLSIKDIQLPLKSTQEEINTVKSKFAAALKPQVKKLYHGTSRRRPRRASTLT